MSGNGASRLGGVDLGGSRSAFGGLLVWVLATLAASQSPAARVPRGDDVRTSDWPSRRRDPSNTAMARLSSCSNSAPARGWTFGVGRHVWGYRPGMSVWSSPALGLVDDRAVLAVGSYDRNVYLLDAADGEVIWRFTTGDGVYAAPLIVNHGDRSWVFATSSDRLIYALDARTGRRVWSHEVAEYRPTTGGSRLSAACLGMVRDRLALFVGHWVWDKSLAHSTQRGCVTAVEAQTGRRLWQVELLDNRVSAPIYARIEGEPTAAAARGGEKSERGMVFVASEDGNLRALEADTGRLVWHHRETEPIMASPAVHRTARGTRVIIGSHFGKLRCLDARDGREVWSFKAGHWITEAAALVSSGQRELVVFGSYNQKVYALDASNGDLVWSQSVAGPVYSAPAVMLRRSEPVVVFAAWDHRLYGFSAEHGTLLWSIYVGQPIWDAIVQGESNWASPVVGKIKDRWMIYHGSYDGVLYAIAASQAAYAGGSQPWSGGRFWLIMLVVVVLSSALAIYLTRKSRQNKQAAR